MPSTKVKLSDFAADLNLSAQEVADRLKELDDKVRKPTAALTDAEMNYLLEYYTQRNEVSDFNAYFADRSEVTQPQPAVKKPTRAAKPKKNEKPEKSEKTEKPAAKKPAKQEKKAADAPKPAAEVKPAEDVQPAKPAAEAAGKGTGRNACSQGGRAREGGSTGRAAEGIARSREGAGDCSCTGCAACADRCRDRAPRKRACSTI